MPLGALVRLLNVGIVGLVDFVSIDTLGARI